MAEIQALQQLEQKLNQVILGKPHAVRLALCCLLSEGHLLISAQYTHLSIEFSRQ